MCTIRTTADNLYVTISRHVLKVLQNLYLSNVRHTEYNFMLECECECVYYLNLYEVSHI